MDLCVCVVGAGVAGLTAANACAERGFPVAVVERSPYPGGRAVSYGCKAAEQCVQCGVCLVREAVDRYSRQRGITEYLSASVTDVRTNSDGTLALHIQRSPNAIDPALCVGCGNCRPGCDRGSIQRADGWGYYVDDSCDGCGACVEACAFGALSLDRPAESESITATDVILAPGFDPYDPARNRKWGYGQTPRVITGTELESFFHAESFVPVALANDFSREGRRVAFVQCVGSRNVTEGVSCCSRVCCAYALRLANRLGIEYPGLALDFYYMDLQHFGRSYESLMTQVTDRIRFVRSNPVSVATRDGRPVVRFDSMRDGRVEDESYDLVVLSHGMGPAQSNRTLARQFGLSLTSEGFLDGRISCDDAAGTVYACGSACGPMGIAESVEQANQVAAIVAARIQGRARRAG